MLLDEVEVFADAPSDGSWWSCQIPASDLTPDAFLEVETAKLTLDVFPCALLEANACVSALELAGSFLHSVDSDPSLSQSVQILAKIAIEALEVPQAEWSAEDALLYLN